MYKHFFQHSFKQGSQYAFYLRSKSRKLLLSSLLLATMRVPKARVRCMG